MLTARIIVIETLLESIDTVWIMLRMNRKCASCDHPLSPIERLAVVYDFGIHCRRCGCWLEVSNAVLFGNMFFSQLAATLVMNQMMTQRGPVFYIVLEIWALFIFLPLLSLVIYSVKRP